LNYSEVPLRFDKEDKSSGLASSHFIRNLGTTFPDCSAKLPATGQIIQLLLGSKDRRFNCLLWVPRMTATEKKLKEAAVWWKIESENNPSQTAARMMAIFEWLVDATPQEREEWFENTGGFEAEMAKAVLNGLADDAPEAALEVLTEMSR
jgi:hypothetical protein